MPIPCERSTESVLATSIEFVSITVIVSWFAFPTKAKWDFGSTAMLSGCESGGATVIVLTTLAAARSIAETVPPVSLVTRPVFPSVVIPAPYG